MPQDSVFTQPRPVCEQGQISAYCKRPRDRGVGRRKRAFDLSCALLGLILLSPLLLVIATMIKWSGGPVVFRHRRVGQNGRPFHLLKFRSMVPGAPQTGLQITIGEDPRITPIGRVLRRTKLDETLQLVNVVRGEMSLVGPRPEVPEYLDLANPIHQAILQLRPGLTDPASLSFWDEATLLATANDPDSYYRTKVLPLKHRLSLAYAGRATMWSDVGMLLTTFIASVGIKSRVSYKKSHQHHLAPETVESYRKFLRQVNGSLVSTHELLETIHQPNGFYNISSPELGQCLKHLTPAEKAYFHDLVTRLNASISQTLSQISLGC